MASTPRTLRTERPRRVYTVRAAQLGAGERASVGRIAGTPLGLVSSLLLAAILFVEVRNRYDASKLDIGSRRWDKDAKGVNRIRLSFTRLVISSDGVLLKAARYSLFVAHRPTPLF